MERPGGTNYSIMIVEECPRCFKQNPEKSFMNCSFDIVKKPDGTILQKFECRICLHKWEIDYK